MWKPTLNNLFLRPYELPEESEGGIIVPDAFRKDRSRKLFEVVAVGPGKQTKKGVVVPCESQVGDVVELEHAYVAQEMPPLDDLPNDLYIVAEDHVCGIRWRPPDDDN